MNTYHDVCRQFVPSGRIDPPPQSVGRANMSGQMRRGLAQLECTDWRKRLGERRTDRKNIKLERSTIAGPEGISQTAESNTPATEQVTPMITEYHVNAQRLWVS